MKAKNGVSVWSISVENYGDPGDSRLGCHLGFQTNGLLQAPYRTYKYLIIGEGRWGNKNIYLFKKKIQKLKTRSRSY